MITKENFTRELHPNFYKQVSKCTVKYNGLFIKSFYYMFDDDLNREYNRIVDTLIFNSDFIDELKDGFESNIADFNTHNLSPQIIMSCLNIALNTELDFEFDSTLYDLTWEFQTPNETFYTIYCDALNQTTALSCH